MPRPPIPTNWPDLPDEDLLDLRLSELPVAIQGSVLEPRIARLRAELEDRGLILPIHFYLSAEWFTADDTTAMAVPFYLAHPRLERLERAQMFEVEGGEEEWCMRILRHEAGHVVDNAFKLRRKRRRRALFGSPALPYPDSYVPRPYSRSFVLHIDPWYAQAHPDEDFAETFAVWLTPDFDWRSRYRGWGALAKLEYMDALMADLRGREPLVIDTTEVEPLGRIRRSLRSHYRAKRRHYGVDHARSYDRALRRIFSDRPEFAKNVTAVRFLLRNRKSMRRIVSSWTGIYQYTVDRVLLDMIARCRELDLRLSVPEEVARHEFIALLTDQSMKYLHSGRHRVAM